MFKRIKESLPDNRKTGLLAIGLVCLIAGQALSKTTSIPLLILRYALFIAAVGIYFYVAFTHHKVTVAKKKARQEAIEETTLQD